MKNCNFHFYCMSCVSVCVYIYRYILNTQTHYKCVTVLPSQGLFIFKSVSPERWKLVTFSEFKSNNSGIVLLCTFKQILCQNPWFFSVPFSPPGSGMDGTVPALQAPAADFSWTSQQHMAGRAVVQRWSLHPLMIWEITRDVSEHVKCQDFPHV